MEVTFLPFLVLDLGRAAMHACLFPFELLGETEEKPIIFYFIHIKLCERHPHTYGLQKSKHCVMPTPFLAERFCKGSGYASIGVNQNEKYVPLVKQNVMELEVFILGVQRIDQKRKK